MDDVKIRELTAQAKLQTNTKHAQEVEKFQADLEGVFSEEVREALALTYTWASTSPLASFEIDGKGAVISPTPTTSKVRRG